MRLATLLQGKTPQERLRILRRVQERIRDELNAQGALFRENKITEAEFKAYKKEVFLPRNIRVCGFINQIKENLGLFDLRGAGVLIDSVKEQALVDAKISTTAHDADIDTNDL